MSTLASFKLGIRSSGGYFISTFLFGVMFGIAATSLGLPNWLALSMGASTFSASAAFSALEFWQVPLPFGTLALSVFLVSTRNILLGMSMAHHFDGHSARRRVLWLFLLNDPGVITSFRLSENVDRLGYVTGYGVALMSSWLLSIFIGLTVADVFINIDLSALDFAGPLVIATMMVLFAKGEKSNPKPWVLSGLVALLLFELDFPAYLILLFSVVAGVTGVFIGAKRAAN